MNVKEMATLLEEELQHHVHINIKTAKADHAVLDVEDEDGNAFILRLTPVKNTNETETDEVDDDISDIDIDVDDNDD